MSKKNDRIETLIDIIKSQRIGSQEKLLEQLARRGHVVTQATLSRDLKMLKTSKVPMEHGEYAYMLPDVTTATFQPKKHINADLSRLLDAGFLSLEFTGNLGVMMTRNGYANGIAYDIDMLHAPEIAGTISGANTVFIALREGVGHEAARRALGL